MANKFRSPFANIKDIYLLDNEFYSPFTSAEDKLRKASIEVFCLPFTSILFLDYSKTISPNINKSFITSLPRSSFLYSIASILV